MIILISFVGSYVWFVYTNIFFASHIIILLNHQEQTWRDIDKKYQVPKSKLCALLIIVRDHFIIYIHIYTLKCVCFFLSSVVWCLLLFCFVLHIFVRMRKFVWINIKNKMFFFGFRRRRRKNDVSSWNNYVVVFIRIRMIMMYNTRSFSCLLWWYVHTIESLEWCVKKN